MLSYHGDKFSPSTWSVTGVRHELGDQSEARAGWRVTKLTLTQHVLSLDSELAECVAFTTLREM